MNETQEAILKCNTQDELDKLAARIAGFDRISEKGKRKLADSLKLRAAQIVIEQQEKAHAPKKKRSRN